MDLGRYRKQMLFGPIGEEGQQRISEAKVLLCGCGALGSVIADILARAGVGCLRIVDRDFVELSNLQRQVLYDEEDVARQVPKAIAAAERLRKVNSEIEIEPIVADVERTNVMEFARGMDIIVDGLDNFETRFLLNDVSLSLGIPWVHGGCVGSYGQVMTFVPGQTPCYVCVMGEETSTTTGETCDTAGVIAPAIHAVAAQEAVETLKWLVAPGEGVESSLLHLDVWHGTWQRMEMSGLMEVDCPTCKGGKRRWLMGDRGSSTTVLCGRNSVQISPAEKLTERLDLAELEASLARTGRVSRNPYLLRFEPDESELMLTLFPDGRLIVQGTQEPQVARQVYSRYFG